MSLPSGRLALHRVEIAARARALSVTVLRRAAPPRYDPGGNGPDPPCLEGQPCADTTTEGTGPAHRASGPWRSGRFRGALLGSSVERTGSDGGCGWRITRDSPSSRLVVPPASAMAWRWKGVRHDPDRRPSAPRFGSMARSEVKFPNGRPRVEDETGAHLRLRETPMRWGRTGRIGWADFSRRTGGEGKQQALLSNEPPRTAGAKKENDRAGSWSYKTCRGQRRLLKK